MDTLNNVQVHTIMDKARMLHTIDTNDTQGYYKPANLLARIYTAKYIDNDMGMVKWLELRYKERYGDI